MIKKQNGMTLIEVLATLVLTSLVIMLIWTTVTISMKYNLAETKKLRMQQEANYIITKIQDIHRTKECYQITNTANEIVIEGCENEDFTLSLRSDYQFGSVFAKGVEIVRPEEEDLSITLVLMDKENKTRYIEIETIITRYKE